VRIVVTLTDRGRELLESHRTPDHEPRQQFYAGDVRTRELSHDAQLYAAYPRVEPDLKAYEAYVLQRTVSDDNMLTSFANGKAYARNTKGDVVCLDLTGS